MNISMVGDGNDRLNGGADADNLSGDGDDYMYESIFGDSIVDGLGYDRLYIGLNTSTTPLTINYTNSAGGTTSGGGSIKEVKYIDLGLF